MHSPYQFADVSSAKQQHSDITFMDMLKQFFPLFFFGSLNVQGHEWKYMWPHYANKEIYLHD